MKTLIKNAKVYVEKGNFQEAIMIEDNLIQKVGTNDELSNESYDEIIDAEGRVVLPGLHDSHQHLYNIGKMLVICRLQDARSVEDMVEAGKKFAAENPQVKENGLYGRGWNQDYFPDKRMPSRKDLDEISTEYPIVFTRACGHICVANSKAFEKLNITKDSPNPEGGVWVKDQDGQLDGLCLENAQEVMYTIFPAPDEQEEKRRFLMAMDYVASQGITGVQCNDTYEHNWPRFTKVLKEIYAENKGKVRYGHQANFMTLDGLKAFLQTEAKDNKEQYDDMHYIAAIKLYKDGSLGARTALMRKPYHDDPSTLGVETTSNELMIQMGKMAKEYGLGIVTHVIGDGAVKDTIDVIKEVNGPENKERSGLVHEQITDLGLLKEVAEANIPVFYQPIFLHYDLHIVEDRVGKELASTSYAFKTQMDLGAHTAFGTDAPIEDSNPFNNIYCAVTRKDLNGFPEGGFYPEEKVTVEEAIDNYTTESAYMCFQENRLGRIRPGYYADLTMIDKDIFTINPDEIKDINAVLTMVDGKITYRKEA